MSVVETAVRSFVDLRAFAADAAFPAATDWCGGRVALALPDGPVSVAALALAGEGEEAEQGHDTFVIVLSGSLELQADGARSVIDAGCSAVVSAEQAFSWRAESGTRAIVMTCTGAPGATGIVGIDENATLEPSGAPLAELLVGPTPTCRNYTDYRSANGEFVCGTWDSTPYHRRAMRYRHYELMHLLEGAVMFEDEAGRIATFNAGDVFLVEQDAECSWLSEVHVKKVYAIYRPTA